MVSRTYTPRELLRMRQVSTSQELYNKLFNKLNKDGDLGEIFRMSPERALPLIEEENLEHDADVMASLEQSPVRQLDGTDAEWKYRGRTESEHGEHQPIGAPTGLSAQKDEGFQRFYKAVVSPTHVRVTAGGRIVPNTRGSSSPTAKWSKDKPGSDGSFMPRAAGHPVYGDATGIPFAGTMPHPVYGPFPPFFPGFVPSVHSPVAAAGHPPFAMMPWQMGLGMSNAFSMLPPNLSQAQHAKSTPKPSTECGTSDKQSEPGISTSPKPVRISPPEHFDQSRPFFFNGQWVMPAGGSFYPYGIPSLSTFPLSGIGAPAVMPPRFTLPAMANTAPVKVDHKVQSHVSSSSSTPCTAGRSAVPVSSIRPSDITKKQIEVLRSSLRYFEDQLQYNKHQIDEKGMETQARMVRQHIQQFEKNLQAQLESEQAHYPTYEHQNDASSSTPRDNGNNSSSTTANDLKSERDSSQSSVSQSAAGHGQAGKPHKELVISRRSSALKQVKSASAPVSTKVTPESSEDCEPLKRPSTLPAGAALAPPFRPRADSTVSVPVRTTFSVSSNSCTEENESVPPVAVQTPDLTESQPLSRKPYLIGQIPNGVKSESGKVHAYMYGRDLTEDELRARHMYWGNAPHHLQKGLPRFDGKDFYPPSPDKSERQASSPTVTASIQTGNVGPDYAPKTPKQDIDPFRSLGKSSQRSSRCAIGVTSHSEYLDGAKAPLELSLNISQSSSEQGYKEFRKVLNQQTTSSMDGCKDKSSDDSEDGSNILFRGRKFMTANGKSRHDIWQRVWKRNKTSVTAVLGTVSSTTARGVLPNYAGHATASLAPAIASVSISPKSSLSKFSNADDLITSSCGTERLQERTTITGVKDNKLAMADI